jgi:hypothetical protein
MLFNNPNPDIETIIPIKDFSLHDGNYPCFISHQQSVGR